MSINLNRKGSGFTIIEVVLVLAIASIIFLLVFLAVPALQASQRDTARKNDVARVVTALANYAGNNSGKVSGITATNITDYTKTLSANTTTVATPAAWVSGTKDATLAQIDVLWSAQCVSVSGGTVTLGTGTVSQAAVITKLEGGNTAFCQSL
jgi:prepilin-type N-terminal cleavage/methylation domain-containing protein